MPGMASVHHLSWTASLSRFLSLSLSSAFAWALPRDAVASFAAAFAAAVACCALIYHDIGAHDLMRCTAADSWAPPPPAPAAPAPTPPPAAIGVAHAARSAHLSAAAWCLPRASGDGNASGVPIPVDANIEHSWCFPCWRDERYYCYSYCSTLSLYMEWVLFFLKYFNTLPLLVA